MLFESFLEEASKAQIEIIGRKYFPNDTVYSREYNGKNYLAVNFSDFDELKSYLPKTAEKIESMLDLKDTDFSLVVFISADGVGANLYFTNYLKVAAKAESNPDGSSPNSAARELIKAILTDTRVKQAMEDIQKIDSEEASDEEENITEEALTLEEERFLQELTNGAVAFGNIPGINLKKLLKNGLIEKDVIGGYRLKGDNTSITESVLTVSIKAGDVDVGLLHHLEKKLLHELRVICSDLEQEDIHLHIKGNKIRANVVCPDDSLTADDVEQALIDLVGMG